MSPPKFNCVKVYNRLPVDDKRIVKHSYMNHFQVSAQSFYKAIRSNNLSAEQLEFFALALRTPISELIARPLVLNFRAQNMQEIASKVGLG